MNPHLPSADADRTAAREPTLDPAATVDASLDSTRPKRPPPPPGAPDLPGYAITGEIAKGGMGRVYAAHDQTLDREVAIKTLLPGANAERFVTESKITAKLPHPNIPPVYALGTLPDGSPFLAMKYVHGTTLSEQLKARHTPADDLPRFAQIFEQIVQAVGFAHSRGIIHRDLKPGNVMVGEFGEVQVMDWGLARFVAPLALGGEGLGVRGMGEQITSAGNAELTAAGAIMGTPGYMAPEQARGEVVDARADVFALGSILTTILTGQPAFIGNTAERVQKVANADLADVFTRLDSCSADAELIALAKRCLSAGRDSRPTDGRAVATEVGTYRAGVEARLRKAETDRAEAVVREGEQRKRRRVLWVAVGVVMTVLVGGIIGTGVGLGQANDARGKEERAKQTAEAAEGREKDRANEAEREKEKAERAATLAREQTALAIAQRSRAEGLLVEGLLAKTRDAIQGENIKLATGLLNDTPWHLRGWEYRHLWTRVTPPQSFRMEAMPTSLCFSADGSRLAASARAGKGSVVRVWTLATGAAGVLPTAPGEWSLHLAAGGKDELVGVRPDLVVQRWDLQSGLRTATSTGKDLHKGAFPEDTHVSFSPDRKWVAYSPSVGGMDYTQQVKVWDVERDELARKLSVYKKLIHTVQFSPKGTHVASSGADRTVRLWDLGADTESVIEPLAGSSRIWFTPDGQYLLATASADNRQWLKRWNVADKKAEQELPWDANLHDLAFSPDGRWMATGEHDGRVRVWEVATATPVRTYHGHTTVVHQVRFSPDGKKLASADYGGLVNVWDAERGSSPPTLTVGKQPVRSAAYAPDGKAFATGDSAGVVTLWSANSATRIKSFSTRLPGDTHLGEAWGVAYSPDGKLVATCGHQVKLWDAKTGTLVKALTGHGAVLFNLVFSPDGKRVYTGTAGWNHITNKEQTGDVWVWEVETGKKLAQFTADPETRGQVDSLTVAPSGQVLTGGYDKAAGGIIKMWDAADHTFARGLTGHPGRVKAMAFNSAGTRMASSCQGDRLIIWDTKTWEPLHRSRIRGGQINCLRYSKDGTRLFGGCQDGSVRVWDTELVQEVLALPAHGKGGLAPGSDVFALALSPDGTRLVSGGTDGTIRLWDSLRSPEYADLSGHSQAVTAVAYSADGSKVYGWDKTGEVLAWYLRDGSPADPADAPEERRPGPLTSPDGRFRAEAVGSTINGGIAVRVWFLPHQPAN